MKPAPLFLLAAWVILGPLSPSTAQAAFLAPAFAATETQPEPTAAPSLASLLSPQTNPTGLIAGIPVARAELQAFYQARAFTPAWDIGYNWKTGQDEDPTRRTTFVDSFLAFATAHGQDHLDPIRDILAQRDKDPSPTAKLQTEILITHFLLKLAHALRGDGLDLTRLYPGWSFSADRPTTDPALAQSLSQAAATNSVVPFLSRQAPQAPAYQDLRRQLERYRALESRGGWPTITQGPTLRPQESSPRIAQLRARLEAEGYKTEPPTKDTNFYDSALQKTVLDYQLRNGLKADGNLGAKTIAALNRPVAARLDQIRANMERWRHMPTAFPSRYAMVNIPAYSLDVIENDISTYRDAVIVGRPERKTPFIQSDIRSVIFNPAWHVPAKIARKDILPKLRKDPHYLEKMGFVINGSANDPFGAAIDWKKLHENEFRFRLRQAPGELNSLGRLKFDFDNDFAVYLHGTPHAELFAKDERPLSSGCVRIQDPEMFAQIVLRDTSGDWTQDKIKTAIAAEKTKWLRLETPLPLYIVYWTVLDSKDDGPAHFRPDIYGYDRLILDEIEQNQYVNKTLTTAQAPPPKKEEDRN